MMRMVLRAALPFLLLLQCAPAHADEVGAGRPPAQDEVDRVFSLLAYAVVYKDWQTLREGTPRGHNIGALLVDKHRQPVFWARNTNFASRSTSQHAEVRLIHNYLECSPASHIGGYTIYTTLEPCAMCAGMMSLTRVTRTVYGQEDALFGNALERLAADHSQSGGDPPYPRLFEMGRSPSSFARRLDEAFANSPDRNIVRWLYGDEARAIYAAAAAELTSLSPEDLQTDAGRASLARARAFLEQVSPDYVPDPAGLCGQFSPGGRG